MILQELVTYYQRLEKEGKMAPPGFQFIEIPFLILLDQKGNFLDLLDTREKVEKKLIGKKFLVPKEKPRTGKLSWKIANLLWDTTEYVLGVPKPSQDKKTIEEANAEAKNKFSIFSNLVFELSETYPQDTELAAVAAFLRQQDFQSVFNHPYWKECQKISGCRITFQVQNGSPTVCENPNVKDFVLKKESDTTDLPSGLCLITGKHDVIERLHDRTPIPGSQSGAKLVAFQTNSGFDSYGKEQSFNAPVSKEAARQYTQALNSLLDKQSRHKFMLGDDTVVFWAQEKNEIEDWLYDIFNEPPKENRDLAASAIHALFKAPETGHPPVLDDLTRFFVLGLSPNAARIAVRFWYAGTVGEFAHNIQQHFQDLQIIHSHNEPEYLSLFRLLSAMKPPGKEASAPAHLAGELMRAILHGTPYPRAILVPLLQRCRVARDSDSHAGVTYPRAALIKAILNRELRFYPSDEKEVTMSLDPENKNIGYRLGRLFAVLEKIQEEAHGTKLNATIRDRFYGSASGSPVTVFPHLLKLKNHHVSKLENRGRATNLEKLISEIMESITDFPAHLSLSDQGRFSIGYYHQRQAFFESKKTNASDNNNQ